MADSTTTVDYLRARLLSERSVSSRARQRADELAKRVMELEEQLKTVTIQRKKAEKATAEALSILETHGVSDLSEACDSSSDQDDVHCVLKESENDSKEENSSTSRVQRGEAEDRLSSSEVETPPNLGRRLSWKGLNNGDKTPDKRDLNLKKAISSTTHRHRNFLLANGSSPKHYSGKSCRRIKRREMGSGNDEGDESIHSPENGDTTSEELSSHSEQRPEISDEISRDVEGTVHTEGMCSSEDQNKEIAVNSYVNGSDRGVEIALEEQDDLIERYQAEEKAQREWEENYRDENNSTLDPCEPGSQSDTTEGANDNGTIIKDKQICITEHQTKRTSSDSPTNPSEALNAPTNFDEGIKVEEQQKQRHETPLVFKPSFQVSEKISRQEWLDIQYQQQEQILPPKPPEDGLGGVLEALQRAKLSLKHELQRLPSPMLALPDPRTHYASAMDSVDIPMGCAGLFRLPTELPSEELSRVPYGAYFDPRSDMGQVYRYSFLEGYSMEGTPMQDRIMRPYMEPGREKPP
ncbi:hypothetical protein QJS04_geneDACA010098 [Acorus gramineus]|uniref:Uncharacterized protein n=1 Tax=Acorus gramineus TaxID=55184 RepID=A0AAV9BGB0_ACOGR|nr:hypothetical protein QJS04_geneDACA010098 [Acorus gramineus]